MDKLDTVLSKDKSTKLFLHKWLQFIEKMLTNKETKSLIAMFYFKEQHPRPKIGQLLIRLKGNSLYLRAS